MTTYETRYAQAQQAVETALAETMAQLDAPQPLLDAMRYSLLAGGKRLRPVLLLAAAEVAGASQETAMPYACALEMIHTYSLIHDDLPAMDDDALRRGKPTNHIVYGEGMALLAGDGLLSLAFEVMLDAAKGTREIAAMRHIARAAGTRGMVAGQCVDLSCEHEKAGGAAELEYIELHKTADLFLGAVGAGLALGGASDAQLQAGETYAKAMGTAFQIQDDLLDIQGDAQALGKDTGMDAARGKLTYPGVYGVQAAQEAVRDRTTTALNALDSFGDRGVFLRQIAEHLLMRDR